jgi:hypothetical protein
MYNCMAVYNPEKKGVVHAVPVTKLRLKSITAGEALVLCGVKKFETFSEANYDDWNDCKLDPRTLKPWGGLGDDGVELWYVNTLPGEVAATTVTSGMVAEHGGGLATEAEDDTPPDDIRDWTVHRCKQWLAKRPSQGVTPTKKADLQEMIIQMYELGLQMVMKEDVDQISRSRFERDTEEWLKVKATRANGITVDLEDGHNSGDVGTLNPADAEFIFKDNNADTKRNRELGQSRHAISLQRSVGKKFKTNFGVFATPVHVTVVIGKSYPGTDALSLEKQAEIDETGHGGRVTSVSGLLVGTDSKGRGGIWIGPVACYCLVPEDMLDRDTEMVRAKKGYRPCRERFCVHCRRAVNAIVDCAPRGVDGANKWKLKKATNRSLDKTSFADSLPHHGHDDYGGGKLKTQKRPAADDHVFVVDGFTWNRVKGKPDVRGGRDYWYRPDTKEVSWDTPLPAKKPLRRSSRSKHVPLARSKLTEIDKGCHDKSSVYHKKFLKFLELKRKSQRNPKMRSRKMKVETVVKLTEGCTCKWSPARGAWVSHCAICEKLKAVYLYDRGLNRTAAFRRAKIRCFIPARKSKGQVAFSQVSAATDRLIARERITIERNNVELRVFSGFDCQINVSEIALAAAEGSVARGTCNEQIRLHDWVERSHGILSLDLSESPE